jgi:hypothetical protein
MTPGTALTTFQSLAGKWSIQRTINSSHSDLLGTFTGEALYKKSSDLLLHYREEGLLERAQCESSCAFREYYFFYNKEIEVYFDAKLTRLFHKIELKLEERYPLKAEAKHYCGEDVYNMAYTFVSEREYRTIVSVKGPRKDYVINSTYNKKE